MASMAPSVNMGHKAKDRLAAFRFSEVAAATTLGKPCPPCSASCCKPCQPPEAKISNASLKPCGVLTCPSFQMECSRSPTTFNGATTSSTKRAFSSSTASTTSSETSSNPGNGKTSFNKPISLRLKTISSIGAL